MICQNCRGTGLQNEFTQCPICKGLGQLPETQESLEAPIVGEIQVAEAKVVAPVKKTRKPRTKTRKPRTKK